MNYSNMDIRIAAMKNGVSMWRIAENIGMTATSFSRKMRHEMSKKDKERVLQAIEKETKGRLFSDD